MDDSGNRPTAQLATAVGVAAVASAALLVTYFAAGGGPFGIMNDYGNAAIGVLSAGLAWRLRRHVPVLVVCAAVVGAAATVVGSALVVSETTGFFLAGLVSSVGFAGIGVWLVVLHRSTTQGPRHLRTLGLVAGALMALGIVVVPGILMRLDDLSTAPWWIWIGELGWLGSYLAYPAWALRRGIVEWRLTPVSRGSASGGPTWRPGRRPRG